MQIQPSQAPDPDPTRPRSPSEPRPVAVTLSAAPAPPADAEPSETLEVWLPPGARTLQIRIYRDREARRLLAASGERLHRVHRDLALLLDFPADPAPPPPS